MVREIPLTKGKVALVDDADHDRVSCFNWWSIPKRHTCYAGGYPYGWKKGKTPVKLHRFILGITDPTVKVDHKNHDGLDNRRVNLRVVTDQENKENRRGAQTNSKLGIRGVSWHKSSRSYRVDVSVGGKRLWGYFGDLEEAKAQAREWRQRNMTHSEECQVS